MVATVDFAHLSLQDALDLAILVEEEAQERYLEFADQMEEHHTPEAARFFAIMARNEQKHGEDLRTRRRALFGVLPPRVKRSQLWDVEAPDYDKARAFMPARQAMQVALASEKKAYEFFVRALPHIADAEVRMLFEELRDEEVTHQSLVREAMHALPPERPDDPGDYEDPPVAH
jgi:rubrerythrin